MKRNNRMILTGENGRTGWKACPSAAIPTGNVTGTEINS
jgi:hypothetical protein